MRAIGIDLGTTYSAIATIGESGRPEIIRNSEGQSTTPSVVLFDEAGEVYVGQQAKMQRTAFPDDIVEFVKRQMGNNAWRHFANEEEYTAEAVAGIILKRLAEDASNILGEEVRSIVVTVPAYFKDAERNATKQAGEIAGLDVIAMINEPTAAALSFVVENKFNGTVLVYDLGGGTFDVTVLDAHDGQFDVKSHEGDRNLGGFDFDNLIMNWAKQQFADRTGAEVEDTAAMEAQLRDRAEQAKHKLSNSDKAVFFVSSGGLNEKLVLTRDQFESLAEGLLRRTEDITEEVIDASGIPKSGIDKVLLVGGSTRMPMVKRMLADVTGQAPDQSVHPDEAVALGAAIAADVRSAERDGTAQQTATGIAMPIVINDVVAHSLGVVADDDQGISKNTVIINADSRIPCQVRRKFFTVSDQQTEIHVQVTEGDDEDLRYIKILGDSTLKVPPHPAQSPIEVIFSCDIDGILHISVMDLTDNRFLGEFEIDRTSNLGQDAVSRMQNSLANLEVQ